MKAVFLKFSDGVGRFEERDIPEWCKRAAEEMESYYAGIDQVRSGRLNGAAAIIAKHAPDVIAVRELVEAARCAEMVVQSHVEMCSLPEAGKSVAGACLTIIRRALKSFEVTR